MRLVVGGRQTGRTTELIKLAAASEAKGEICYIVCHSQSEAYRIAKEAKKMELQIGFPLTYDEFLGRRYAGYNIKKFYIDNLEALVTELSHVPIEVAMW